VQVEVEAVQPAQLPMLLPPCVEGLLGALKTRCTPPLQRPPACVPSPPSRQQVSHPSSTLSSIDP
jgi:hypothetical protein